MKKTKQTKTKQNKTKRGGASLNSSPINVSLLEIDFNDLSNIIIRYKGTQVAYAQININKNICMILNIYVEDMYRGKKIGKFILKNLLAFIFSNPSINNIELYDETQSKQFNPNRGMGKIPNQMYLKAGSIQPPLHP